MLPLRRLSTRSVVMPVQSSNPSLYGLLCPLCPNPLLAGLRPERLPSPHGGAWAHQPQRRVCMATEWPRLGAAGVPRDVNVAGGGRCSSISSKWIFPFVTA